MRRYKIEVEGKPYTIDVQELKLDEFYVIVGDQHFDVRLVMDEDVAEAVITPGIAPTTATASASPTPTQTTRRAAVKPPAPETLPPVPAAPQPALPPKPQLPTDGLRPNMTAPMPGTILSINVQPGDKVTRGQTVMVLEAMKMKNALKSPQDGTVSEVKVQAGQAVGYGDVLLSFEQT